MESRSPPGASSSASAARSSIPGRNVGLGSDYTIYALIEGVVKFEHKSKSRYKVSVYPAVRENAPAA